VPAQNCVGREQNADLLQSSPPQSPALHCQPTSLVIIQQEASLAEFLLEHLIFSPQVGNDFLLLTVHPARKGHKV
jgi:hypothetical protein